MSQMLEISDSLYMRLQTETRRRGLDKIEELLELWHPDIDDLNDRQQIVHRIDALRKQLCTRYGLMPDSTDLIREDRER